MLKPYPQGIPLKKQKCPHCKTDLEAGKLKTHEGVVQLVCRKQGCGYSVDLFWLGDLASSRN